jgi:hypothetical protein
MACHPLPTTLTMSPIASCKTDHTVCMMNYHMPSVPYPHHAYHVPRCQLQWCVALQHGGADLRALNAAHQRGARGVGPGCAANLHSTARVKYIEVRGALDGSTSEDLLHSAGPKHRFMHIDWLKGTTSVHALTALATVMHSPNCQPEWPTQYRLHNNPPWSSQPPRPSMRP